MKVEKIYQTIQGEGPNVGRPAVFVELIDKGKEMTVEKILEVLLETRPSRLLIITGDEPLRQMQELSETVEGLLHQVLRREQYSFEEIEIETSGMIIPTGNLYWLTDSFVVTPRVFTKESASKYDQLWNSAKSVVTTKLAIKTKKDLEVQMNWIKNMVKTSMAPHDIFVVPNATDNAKIKEIARWLVPVCINEGFRLSPRLKFWLEEGK